MKSASCSFPNHSEQLEICFPLVATPKHDLKKNRRFQKLGTPKVFPLVVQVFFSTKRGSHPKKIINHQQDRHHWPGVKGCFFVQSSWRFPDEIAGSEVFPMQPIWVSGTQKKEEKNISRCKWTTDWQKEMRKELWGFWRSLKAKWQILAKALFHLRCFWSAWRLLLETALVNST